MSLINPASWAPMTPLMLRITTSDSSAAASTDGTRPSRIRRNTSTSGASTRDSRTASVIGSSTSRASESAATTTTQVARVIRPDVPGVWAGGIVPPDLGRSGETPDIGGTFQLPAARLPSGSAGSLDAVIGAATFTVLPWASSPRRGGAPGRTIQRGLHLRNGAHGESSPTPNCIIGSNAAGGNNRPSPIAAPPRAASSTSGR